MVNGKDGPAVMSNYYDPFCRCNVNHWVVDQPVSEKRLRLNNVPHYMAANNAISPYQTHVTCGFVRSSICELTAPFLIVSAYLPV